MVQVLVEELKEFVDVLQVSSSEDFQIEVNSFFRRRKRRSSSLEVMSIASCKALIAQLILSGKHCHVLKKLLEPTL